MILLTTVLKHLCLSLQLNLRPNTNRENSLVKEDVDLCMLAIAKPIIYL